MRRTLAALAALATSAALAGCQGGKDPSPSPTPADTGTYGTGNSSLTTTEYLELLPDPGTRAWVQGLLLEQDGVARLCTVLLESYPPQCADGISVTGVPEDLWTNDESGVRWNDGVYTMLVEAVSDTEAAFIEMPDQVG